MSDKNPKWPYISIVSGLALAGACTFGGTIRDYFQDFFRDKPPPAAAKPSAEGTEYLRPLYEEYEGDEGAKTDAPEKLDDTKWIRSKGRSRKSGISMADTYRVIKEMQEILQILPGAREIEDGFKRRGGRFEPWKPPKTAAGQVAPVRPESAEPKDRLWNYRNGSEPGAEYPVDLEF